MTQDDIKTKITDLENRVKNPSLPASAVSSLNKMIADLKSKLDKEEPKEEAKKEESKAPAKEEAKVAKKRGAPKKAAKVVAKKEDKAPAKKVDKPKRHKGEKDEKDCDELADREKAAQKSGYDIDELLDSVKKSRKAAADRAAKKKKEPVKTPATKNKEAVEKTTDRVAENIAKRADKGEVGASEIKKLISEYEAAIKKLQKLLEKLGTKKMEHGGSVKRTQKELDKDKEYKALGVGERVSHKTATIYKKDGTAFKRRNVNQFGATEGGNEYTEKRANRTDKIK